MLLPDDDQPVLPARRWNLSGQSSLKLILIQPVWTGRVFLGPSLSTVAAAGLESSVLLELSGSEVHSVLPLSASQRV